MIKFYDCMNVEGVAYNNGYLIVDLTPGHMEWMLLFPVGHWDVD